MVAQQAPHSASKHKIVAECSRQNQPRHVPDASAPIAKAASSALKVEPILNANERSTPRTSWPGRGQQPVRGGQQPVRAKHTLSTMISDQTGPWQGDGTMAELGRARSAGTGARSAREALEEQQRLQAALLQVVLRVHGQQEKIAPDWLLSAPASLTQPMARLGCDRQDQVRKAARASSLPTAVAAPAQSEPSCHSAFGAVAPNSLRRTLEPASAGTTPMASSRRPQEPGSSLASGAATRHSPELGSCCMIAVRATPSSRRSPEPGSLRSVSVDTGMVRRPAGSNELSGQFLAAMRGQTAPLTPRRAPPAGSARWRGGSAPSTRKEQTAHLSKEKPTLGPVMWRVDDILLSGAAAK